MSDLLDLVEAEVDEAESKITKMFDWHYDRVKTTAQWILGAAASLVISLVIAYSKDELAVSNLAAALMLGAAVVFLGVGIFRMWRLSKLQREFVAALSLLSKVKRIRSFVVRYREMT